MSSYMLKRTLFVSIMFLFFYLTSFAQSNEHIVILWDVTGSLLPQQSGEKDLNGATLPTYAKGNGMWVPLKKSVIECINYTDEDPENEITIVTFNDNIRDIITRKASSTGKNDLDNWVTNYTYQSHNYTNIVDPVKKFYSLLNSDKIQYMFLFTDGDNDQPATKTQLIPTLNSWTEMTQNKKAYGFYVLVHPDADKKEIRKSVESQDNFWIVKDTKVRIKICSLPSVIKYNVRDEKGPKMVPIRGKYAGANGEVDLVTDDIYYDVVCSDKNINNGRLNIEVKPKSGVTPPENHTVVLVPKITNADPYTFVGPKDIRLNVSNLPERSLNLGVDNKDLGEASYYDSFLFCDESNVPVTSNIKVDFSEQAKLERSSAIMKVYLVDEDGQNKLIPASQNLTISINGEELVGDTYTLTPEMSNFVLSIVGHPNTEEGSYYGRIELVPTRLDNSTINGTSEVFKWKMTFEKYWNPLLKCLLTLLAIIVAVLFIWFAFLQPTHFKKFRKSVLVAKNGQNIDQFNCDFTGCRKVIFAKQKVKQSMCDRIFNGEIKTIVKPHFEQPVVFVARRKGRSRVAWASGNGYMVQSNPIPQSGVTIITHPQDKLKITLTT